MVDYYRRQGIKAWSNGEVPFRISSNPYIANAYAEIIIGYLRDVSNVDDSVRSVTIIELGAGSGQFGYLLARALVERTIANAAYKGPSFKYLMTDVADSNVSEWAKNPRLRFLVEQGIMEFAVLDVADPYSAMIAVSRRSLEQFNSGNPVVVIANYVLDVLVHDAFSVRDGKLNEVRIGVEIGKKMPEIIGSKEVFESLAFNRTATPVKFPYYNEPDLDSVLKSYSTTLKSATFLFPVSALRFMEKVGQMSGGRMLMIVSDKAYIRTDQLEGQNGLNLAVTGSFSAIINLDAVARWIGEHGGVVKVPDSASSHFDTYAFLLRHTGDFVNLSDAFSRAVDDLGPASYWAVAENVMHHTGGFTLRALLGFLKLSCYDPYLVMAMKESLLQAANEADVEGGERLYSALSKVWGNYYPMGGNRARRDVAFLLGRLFRRLRKPERSLECFRASMEEFGAHCSVLRNIGICYEELGEKEEALSYYREASRLRPDRPAEEGITRLSQVDEIVASR